MFPTNKMASIGLLGRVHRGTPWQTVYFKPDIAPLTDWENQSTDKIFYQGRDLSRTHPTNDWKLADLFTTALDGRNSRGLASLNQTNLETWSAVFSGVVVVSNSLLKPIIGDTPKYEERFIEPWGNTPLASSGFAQIWTSLYNYQSNQLAQGRSLQSLGELIQKVPELTTKSPFLNQSSDDLKRFGLDDFAYEQIPQQILSLLRVGQSRFVIYAYGQSLKPAQIDPGSGVVVNYQVTAEFATRTVVRVEGNPRGRLRTVVESFNILPPD